MGTCDERLCVTAGALHVTSDASVCLRSVGPMYVARYVAGLCLARAMTATTGAEKAGNDLMNTNLLGLFVWGEAQEEWRPPLQQPLASSHPSSLPPLLQFKFSAKIFCTASALAYIILSACKANSFNLGALIIRIGFWGPLYYILIIRNHQNSIGNYFGPL